MINFPGRSSHAPVQLQRTIKRHVWLCARCVHHRLQHARDLFYFLFSESMSNSWNRKKKIIYAHYMFYLFGLDWSCKVNRIPTLSSVQNCSISVSLKTRQQHITQVCLLACENGTSDVGMYVFELVEVASVCSPMTESGTSAEVVLWMSNAWASSSNILDHHHRYLGLMCL